MRLTIQCGIIELTKSKQDVLEREYNNLQKFLQGEDVTLYSANKQQALRYYRKVKQKEYPISLRKDLIDVQKAKTFWFLKIPVVGVRGGLKVPIKPHREFPKNSILCESKIVRKDNKFIAMLTFEFETPKLRKCSSVLSIDLGEHFTATAVLLQDRNVMKVQFYGREIRGIRRHYSWLRKRLQERGLTKVVKRIGRKENRCVSDILHKVSTDIVNLADSSNSCIVLGDLTGIRNQRRGKLLNRIVSNMTYYKLTKMIEYKAQLLGIPVIQVSEAYTSQECHICGEIGKRKSQGLFVCKKCGEWNADYNGARNIAKGLFSYMLISGVFCEHALNRFDECFAQHHESPEAPSVRAE
jgi:IS605 OrfB family transposase